MKNFLISWRASKSNRLLPALLKEERLFGWHAYTPTDEQCNVGSRCKMNKSRGLRWTSRLPPEGHSEHIWRAYPPSLIIINDLIIPKEVWLPRSALPAMIWLSGKMGMWLGGSVARQPRGQEILTDQQPASARYGVSFRGQAHPYFSLLFSFLFIPLGFEHAVPCFTVFCVFSAQPLHVPSCTDRRELPSIAA